MSYTEITACRCCGNTTLESILSLGVQELTGVFPRSANEKVTSGPLELVKCFGAGACGLVQLRHSYDTSEMYGQNYGYRSGLNQSMVRHLGKTAARILEKYPVEDGAIVLDIGSNDGTTLSFMPETAHRVGMDPTIVKYGQYYKPGIQAIPEFFSAATFQKHHGDKKASIVTSIAMFYDLEDPLAFVRDIAKVLAPNGVWYFEQSYLPTMLSQNAYNTYSVSSHCNSQAGFEYSRCRMTSHECRVGCRFSISSTTVGTTFRMVICGNSPPSRSAHSASRCSRRGRNCQRNHRLASSSNCGSIVRRTPRSLGYSKLNRSSARDSPIPRALI